MHILPVQFRKQSGPDATKTFKLELDVDESQKQSLLELTLNTNKGDTLILLVFKPDEDDNMMEDLVSENPSQTKKKLRNQMHAMINSIAKDNNREPDQIKDLVRDYLKKKDYIKESTSELDIEGFSAAIYYLNNEFRN